MNRPGKAVFAAAGWLIVSLWFGLSGTGCANRDRSNPIDPLNPDTGGKPQNLRVTSENDEVFLTWSRLPGGMVDHYSVYRSSGNMPSPVKIGDTASGMYTDSGVPLGQKWTYRITAVTNSEYESVPSDSVSITPGPHSYWVTDYYGETVYRLTYDAMHMLDDIYDFYLPVAVASDTANALAWTLDWRDGILMKIAGGRIVKRVPGLRQPRLVELDRRNQVLWVVHDSLRTVALVDTAGAQTGELTGFGRIVDICWAGGDRGFWIVDADSQTVSRYGPAGNRLNRIACNAPAAVTASDAFDWIWAADSRGLLRISTEGALLSVIGSGYGAGFNLSMNGETGGCWAVMAGEDGITTVVHMDRDGRILAAQSGFGTALHLLCNPFDAGCIIADFYRGQVIRLAATGEELSRLSGFYGPTDLDFGP
ncbi:hypothetical protein JW948_14540 [bacterium]|nr:hypothetical protein [bacterium]